MKKLFIKFASVSILFGMCACQNQEIDTNVAITTDPVTEVTDNAAISGGNITHDGGSAIRSYSLAARILTLMKSPI